jgi:hypothetical protein
MQLESVAPRWRGAAFGVEIAADEALPGMAAASAASAGRLVEWHRVSAASFDTASTGAAWISVVDLRHDGGALFLSVDFGEAVGFRISAPGFGRHLVSQDGRILLSHVPRRCVSRWERLFYAQPLPLAAALQGLELVHASAVVIDGSAVALVAASGTGKTSVAAHLVASGAVFLTDDVLALEEGDGRVLAHPGPGRLAIDEAELRRLASDIGVVSGRSDKLHLALDPAPQPAPLRAVYFLRRVPEGNAIVIAREEDARPLLASSFLSYLRSPDRLLVHLDVCARIAGSVPMLDLAIPARMDAQAVAHAVRDHFEGMDEASK